MSDDTLSAMKRRVPVLILAWTLVLPGCSVVKEFQQAIVNLRRCEFKLDNVADFQLAGITLSGKTGFDLLDAGRIMAAIRNNQLPAAFTLNVAARNPNDGTGGTTSATATMTSFAWTLLIDNSLTISGDISSPITIPGSGQQTTIPLQMSLDLLKFFRDKDYEHLANLALALGGANNSPSRLVLRARPSIKTDYGTITYPGEIDIIDREFR